MIKCFLSHSSSDKELYVRAVKNLLRKESLIYDENTFEAGMSPAEEIIHGLDETSLFVIFISDSALESKWVKDEVYLAKGKVDEGKIDRIYPIIIDEKITYEDPRIPKWMKDGFNIQHIRQPKIAARKINSRLRELAWRNHPTLRERENIFVGRNSQIQRVEERFDDYSSVPPIVFIASGLSSIGRKSFIKHSLRKANIIRESYSFPQIFLDENDSIEDFILKLNDLGFSDEIQTNDLLKTTIENKIHIASKLVESMINEKERVLIEDRGAIVQYDGEVVDWFSELIDCLSVRDHLCFCIASKFRANRSIKYKKPEFYMEEIPELERLERSGLLNRYSKFRNLDLSREDLSFFTDVLTGYPEQAIYTIDMISESSVFEARKNSHLIQEYAKDKAKLVVDSLKEDHVSLNFLYFLSKFEFIGFEFLFSLVEEKTYFPILSKFLLSSFCERIGSSGDYIRVNEVIKDYIDRSRFGMPTEFSEKLKIHVQEFINSQTDDNRDISDYIFSIQEALIAGKEIPDRMLVPSYFLKTIRSVYKKGGSTNYKEVIKLSDRVLINSRYLHKNILEQIYFLKCQALARLREPAFFGVVKNLSEPENSFLHGFYYRIQGDQEKAINNYSRVLQRRPNDFRTKSELVLTYMQGDEHELAYELAKEIYNHAPNNPLNANNYLSCILHRDKNQADRALIEEIVGRLESNPTDKAQEMYSSARAKILAHFDKDTDGAYSLLEETIIKYPDVTYPILTLADIAIHFKNTEKLGYAINLLDIKESKNSQTYRTYIRYKSIYIAMQGSKSDAMVLAKNELKGVRKEAFDEFINRLSSM
ncbi:TIR domain-containing protein [Aeromonas veronii]